VGAVSSFGPTPLSGKGGIGLEGSEHCGRAPPIRWYGGNSTIPQALKFSIEGCRDMDLGRWMGGPDPMVGGEWDMVEDYGTGTHIYKQ